MKTERDPMQTEAEAFETKVRAAEQFIKHVGTRKAAEYLAYQQSAIDGLNANNEAWQEAWRDCH